MIKTRSQLQIKANFLTSIKKYLPKKKRNIYKSLQLTLYLIVRNDMLSLYDHKQDKDVLSQPSYSRSMARLQAHVSAA